MLTKIFIVFALLIIIYNLGRGMHFLLKDQGRSERTVRALSWRIGLSFALLAFLFVAFAMGWIHPHPIVP